ncbi:MAG: DnaB-like helicase C-terminal domain-containing protein [Parabacteroides merdae]
MTLQMAPEIAARAGKSVCFFSLEMSSLQMLNRVLAGMTDVNPDHLRINKPTGRELETVGRGCPSG